MPIAHRARRRSRPRASSGAAAATASQATPTPARGSQLSTGCTPVGDGPSAASSERTENAAPSGSPEIPRLASRDASSARRDLHRGDRPRDQRRPEAEAEPGARPGAIATRRVAWSVYVAMSS